MENPKGTFVQGIAGAMVSVIFALILSAMKQDGIVPAEYFWIFILINLAAAIGSIFTYQTAGFFFNIGWIIGAWLLKDAMDTAMFWTYFIAPIVILVIRIFIYAKKYLSSN